MASPAALALITTTFPAGKERNRAFAVYAAMAGVGAAVGLILGGWLTGLRPDPGPLEGWRYTFLIVVPIGLAAAFFAPRFLTSPSATPGGSTFPVPITGTGALLAIVFGHLPSRSAGLRVGRAQHRHQPGPGVALLGGLPAGRVPRRAPLDAVPDLQEQPNRAAAFAVMMIVPAAMFAMFFFLSLFIQLVVGYSPLHTGVAFLPFSVAMIISARRPPPS